MVSLILWGSPYESGSIIRIQGQSSIHDKLHLMHVAPAGKVSKSGTNGGRIYQKPSLGITYIRISMIAPSVTVSGFRTVLKRSNVQDWSCPFQGKIIARQN